MCTKSATTTPLERHLEFRAKAKGLLKGDPDHSIWSQLTSVFWHDAAYRVFNEARKSATNSRPTAAIAPLLTDFVDQAYVFGEITAIGRLTDEPSSEPGRGVVSLPTVLRLVRGYRPKLTRELFVTYDGAPYDPAPHEAAARVGFKPGAGWVAREPWRHSEDRHKLFDRLSHKPAMRRSPADIIHRSVLTACEQRLKTPTILLFRTYRNKVIAHAADATSRDPFEALSLSMADVDAAHRAILEVAETLSTIALGEILVGVPVASPQFDILEHLERPYMSAKDRVRIEAHWMDHAEKRERWSSDAVAAVLGR